MLSDEELERVKDRAKCAFREDREASAAELLALYVSKRQDDAAAWIVFSDSLYLVGRLSDARQAILRALRLGCSPSGEIANRLAVIYSNQGKRRRAEVWFARATRVVTSPEDDHVFIMRGANLAVMGLYDEAVACYRRAIELGGKNCDEAFLNLGLALRAKREYPAAVEAFKNALDLDPDYAEARTALNSLAGIDETLEFMHHLTTDDDDS